MITNEKSVKNRITDAVKARISGEVWFRGVCTDCLTYLSEEEMEKNFDKLVESVEDDTFYWDGQWWKGSQETA